MTTIYDVTRVQCPHCGENIVWPQNTENLQRQLAECRHDLNETMKHLAEWQRKWIGCRKQRGKLLAACEAVQPTLYGMLLERWGKLEDWPNNAQGAVVYRKLRVAIAKAKGE